ncbi:MAG TPA: alpha/beta fold hydrolase, partial [Ktedonobacterales bacterium]
MSLDVELYRRTIAVPLSVAPIGSGTGPVGATAQRIRRLSVIDIAPEGATRAMVLVHGFGGRAMQWIYQLRAFGQTLRVVALDLRGHGQSDDPDEVPIRLEDLVDDLELVLTRLEVPAP